MSAAELASYYKGKSKKQDLYGYDDDGNLVEYNKEGTVIKTIALPNYRPPTFEEFDEMEKERMDAITLATKEFEDARIELRNALTRPEIADSEVLRINRNVREADIKLQVARFPLRYIESDEKYEIRNIDFDQPSEQRKYPYDIAILKTSPFTLQKQYVRIGKVAEQPLISVAEANAAAAAARTGSVILFAEPETNDYGFLSLNWTVEIEFNAKMYNSAKQAIAAELAKSFNDENNLNTIMLAETPDAVDYSLEDVPGDKEVNEIKWNDLTKRLIFDINLVKFNQYPELAARLLETRDAQLGAYIPDDNLIGIGISLDNIQSKNPINWTGQNLLGKALMEIRQKIRTDRETIASASATVATSAAVAPKRRRRIIMAPKTDETRAPVSAVEAVEAVEAVDAVEAVEPSAIKEVLIQPPSQPVQSIPLTEETGLRRTIRMRPKIIRTE